MAKLINQLSSRGGGDRKGTPGEAEEGGRGRKRGLGKVRKFEKDWHHLPEG
jgi:hypothetical protein